MKDETTSLETCVQRLLDAGVDEEELARFSCWGSPTGYRMTWDKTGGVSVEFTLSSFDHMVEVAERIEAADRISANRVWHFACDTLRERLTPQEGDEIILAVASQRDWMKEVEIGELNNSELNADETSRSIFRATHVPSNVAAISLQCPELAFKNLYPRMSARLVLAELAKRENEDRKEAS
jgi:hypothetical protein